MKSKMIYLFVALFAVTLSSCSKENVIVKEPEYPLDNGQWYQLEGGTLHWDMIYFDKNVFHYEESGRTFSCNYKYLHPTVTLILVNDTTYQFSVGENYFKFPGKDEKDYFFYSKGEKNW